MVVGILALQGCIGPHEKNLNKLGIESVRVRSKGDLDSVDRIILPGGESTTMLRLLNVSNLLEPLRDFSKSNPTWGVCAGAILLAKEVTHPVQDSLALMNMRAYRNYYGSQLYSFSTEINVAFSDSALTVDFIRAPAFELLNDEPEVLSHHKDKPILVREGHLLASAFHVELKENTAFYEYFLAL